jgi:hypothetical protein
MAASVQSFPKGVRTQNVRGDGAIIHVRVGG